eukprot:11987453-Alexandrium_andersonii.AAC.1
MCIRDSLWPAQEGGGLKRLPVGVGAHSVRSPSAVCGAWRPLSHVWQRLSSPRPPCSAMLH